MKKKPESVIIGKKPSVEIPMPKIPKGAVPLEHKPPTIKWKIERQDIEFDGTIDIPSGAIPCGFREGEDFEQIVYAVKVKKE